MHTEGGCERKRRRRHVNIHIYIHLCTPDVMEHYPFSSCPPFALARPCSAAAALFVAGSHSSVYARAQLQRQPRHRERAAADVLPVVLGFCTLLYRAQLPEYTHTDILKYMARTGARGTRARGLHRMIYDVARRLQQREEERERERETDACARSRIYALHLRVYLPLVWGSRRSTSYL